MHKLMAKFAAGALLLALVGSAAAEDGDSKAIDQKVYMSLRDVINRGADMYNNGDPAGCFRLFEGALLTVRPLLDNRPELQKSIDAGLAGATGNPDMRRRAWALRKVLDDVRDRVHAQPGAVVKGGKQPEKVERTLWDRLGGEAAVSKVVDDFAALAASDEKVNFSRDGKYKPTDEQLVALKKSLVAFISSATGGPLKYTGKSMKEVHKGMGITDEEFNAAGNDLVKALAKNGVPPEDIDALMRIVETTRKDIVEAKAEPKDEDKPKAKEKEKKDEDKPKEKEKDEKPKEKDDDKPKEKDEKPKEKDEKKDEKKDE